MNLDTPIIAIDVEIMDGDGNFLSETVELSLSDFAVDDVRAAAYWEEVDPDTYHLFATGKITAGDFGASAIRMRAFLYALTRAKVRDPRIRRTMGLDDFTMKTSDLQAISDAISDLPDDLTELLTEA